ncbi:GrpB family protein [Staphylococcus ureilyticus]|uniref:GrpB family protein n=1 Tax=Staphylococcus ureilyticus TaxID=94138 RepID=UPI0021CF4E85|nr:GrpB family protein [Staphylococcus ureilyticus]MDU0462051.1 GrpB family protein [Staphylococcus ureilyticus]UXS59845.1 GrpB family protein [Staphylococcus ureilyticus]
MEIILKKDYEKWEAQFVKEKELLLKVVGKEIIEVHHIGSTAIKDIYAKPVIDIMVVVENIMHMDSYNNTMRQLGYEPQGESGISGRRFYIKGVDTRTHHVHMFQFDNYENIDRHLALRDYLNANKTIAKEYEKLKIILANKYSNNRSAYSNGKSSFIKHVEREALKWYQRNQDG